MFSNRLWLCGVVLAFWSAMGLSLLAQEPCPPASECGPAGCLRSAWARWFPREPYRPFDDHFPRFHPVPTGPVFPSLEEPNEANGAEGRPQRNPRELIPRTAPPQGYPPAPVPETVAPPSTKSGGSAVPQRVPVPREASRPAATSATWIFLPAAAPDFKKEEGHRRRGPEMASEGERLIR